jgi:hypothetical protein|nr:WhiB family transcriptional regulator [uncultured Gordonia sp.]
MTDRTRRAPGADALLAEILRGTASLAGAACKGVPPQIFDPPAHGETLAEVEHRHRAALNYCDDCDVVEQCARWAAQQPSDGSVRAGQRPQLRGPGRPQKAG